MGRKVVGPRLWFRPDRLHSTRGSFEAGKWIIRDGAKMISTGFGRDDRAKAELALTEYLSKGVPEAEYLVYFVSADAPNFPIKIGISQHRIARFSQLQNALPYDVDILAIMPTKDPLFERRLHKRFRHLRLRGEWFERSQELLDYIQLLQDSDEAA